MKIDLICQLKGRRNYYIMDVDSAFLAVKGRNVSD